MASIVGTSKKLKGDSKYKIKLLQPDKPIDPRPWKGSHLIAEPFANIFLCAKKKSGKTTVIANLLRACCGKKTIVWLFSGSLHRDPNWLAIKKMLDEKGIAHVDHLSVYDDKTGEDLVRQFMDMVKQPEEKDEPEDDKEEQKAEPVILRLDAPDAAESKERPKREHKSKYQYVDHFLIFDDLGASMKNMKSFDTLLKTNRHWRSKIIVSSQYPNDISPEARKQLNNWIIFAGHPPKKLQEIYRDSDLHIPAKEFAKGYYYATRDPFNFLYIDTDNKKQPLRKNFDEPYIIAPAKIKN